MQIRNREEFIPLIEKIDADLESKSVPISCRIQEAAKEVQQQLGVKIGFGLTVGSAGPLSWDASNLGRRIFDWYRERYGNKSQYDMDLGKAAVWLRGDVWFMRIPIVFDWDHDNVILDTVEDLTVPVWQSLTQPEKNEIRRVFRLASKAFTHLLVQKPKRFMDECASDHGSAVSFLRPPQPHPGQSKWASLQATEKIIKAYIVSKKPQAKYVHDLVGLAADAEVLGLNPVNRALLANIQCTAGARYGDEVVTMQETILAHHSALEISSTVAAQII